MAASPVTVIAELLGVPKEDQLKFGEWSRAIIMGGTRGADLEKVGIAALEFIMYFHEKFDERREHPQEDLITALVQAEADEHPQRLDAVPHRRAERDARRLRERRRRPRRLAVDLSRDQ